MVSRASGTPSALVVCLEVTLQDRRQPITWFCHTAPGASLHTSPVLRLTSPCGWA
jgi:hypothetical protein